MTENKKTIEQEQYAQPEVSSKKGFSPVWILPIVAVLIGFGLILKSFLDGGIMITLQLPSAEGIEVGKTHVRYKGMSAGVVKERSISDDLQNVILHIEMNKRTESFLNENTKFWLVEPRISLSGISGLDTLLGGRYIAIDAREKGKEKRAFIALDIPPPPSTETPGLHIKLRLNRLASIDRGTIIYYKQIPVGKVTNYTLAEKDTEIVAWVLIDSEYAHLVKENSHFYNVSGIDVNASLSGIKIKTESLVSVLAGGIAFYNPRSKNPSKAAKRNASYLLYNDFESAQVGIPIVLRFKNTESIQENNTEIKFQGKKIGSIGQFSYDKTSNEVITVASIEPTMEDILTENTQFWIVKPSVSLLNVNGLDALISGNYIQVRPVLDGKEKREFKVMESAPMLSKRSPGLHFFIESEALGSISKSAPIYFKNISVGHIKGFKLSDDAKTVHLRAFVKPEFSHLVKTNSRFYNTSGLNIKGGLSGINVKMESITSLLKGGVSFYNPDYTADKQQKNTIARNDDSYKLYNDFDDAKAGVKVILTFNTAVGLSEDMTKIIFKGVVLGVIKKITPNKSQRTVTATAILDPIAENSLVEDSKFWMVKPKIGITEIQNIDTIVGGDYITVRPGISKKKQTKFFVAQKKPALSYNSPGLHLKIKSSHLGSISIGSPVMYNRIKIGDVQDYELDAAHKGINILIHIWPQYMNMINAQSRFYGASGIQINAGLSGIKIQTGSIESILNGGIALFNEKNSAKKNNTLKKLTNGHTFKLFKDFYAARLNAFYVRVQFKDTHGLSIGSKVQYKGIDVGEVEAINLNKKDHDSVWVTLELDSLLKPILGKKSAFWIKTAKLGLAKTENIDALIKGSYVAVKPVKGRTISVFKGLKQAPLLERSNNGFTVNLSASRLSSLKTGDPVYYRQVKVGEVIGYELADTADQILIYLNIRKRFKSLIRENSQFWHASGIDMNISLFGTSTIRTESLEAILEGGIAFATPDNEQMGRQLPSGSFFVLHDKPKTQWTLWNPIIQLPKETQQY